MSDAIIYKPEHVRRVLGKCPDTPTGVRDAALIFALWCSGLRCAELCSLKPADVEPLKGTVWVAAGKGGKSRTVVVPESSREELAERIGAWEYHRVDLAFDRSPLFCNLQGGRIDESYIRRMFRDVAQRARLKLRFHPHGLRHTFASTMHLAGVPLDVIMRQLGHSDLSVTGAYLKRIGSHVVTDAMADFSLE